MRPHDAVRLLTTSPAGSTALNQAVEAAIIRMVGPAPNVKGLRFSDLPWDASAVDRAARMIGVSLLKLDVTSDRFGAKVALTAEWRGNTTVATAGACTVSLAATAALLTAMDTLSTVGEPQQRPKGTGTARSRGRGLFSLLSLRQ